MFCIGNYKVGMEIDMFTMQIAGVTISRQKNGRMLRIRKSMRGAISLHTEWMKHLMKSYFVDKKLCHFLQ